MNEELDRPARDLKPWLAYPISAAIGLLYGLLFRGLGDTDGDGMGVMMFTFVFVVPFVLGVATVVLAPGSGRGILYAIFAPWLTATIFMGASLLVGWEGMICLVLALPIQFGVGSLGGLIVRSLLRENNNDYVPGIVLGGFMILPLAGIPIESQFTPPDHLARVETSIDIAAPTSVVWQNIARVPAIREEEHSSSFSQVIGFPRPIEATLSHEGVGGVRHATFEGGILFIETVTEWVPEKKLSFTIDPNTDSIPATTLDQHVTVGGRYFDVLTGTYELEPLANGHIRLHLWSEQRVSTNFNFYTAIWTEAVMGDIQEYILEIIKRRCEAPIPS